MDADGLATRGGFRQPGPAMLVAATVVMAMHLAGCATTMSRAQLNQLEARGKVAVVVAPIWHSMDYVGVRAADPGVEAVFGGKAPWRGDNLLAVNYNPIGIPYFHPFDIDTKAVARDLLVRGAKATLGVDLIVVEGSPRFGAVARDTYWDIFSSHDLINFSTGGKRTPEEWKAFRGEGYAAIMVVEVRRVHIGSAGVGCWVGLVVIDAETGKIVHRTGDIGGMYNRGVPAEVMAPFFPEIDRAATIFGAKDELKSYHKAVTRDPGHTARLKAEIEALLAEALTAELKKIAEK